MSTVLDDSILCYFTGQKQVRDLHRARAERETQQAELGRVEAALARVRWPLYYHTLRSRAAETGLPAWAAALVVAALAAAVTASVAFTLVHSQAWTAVAATATFLTAAVATYILLRDAPEEARENRAILRRARVTDLRARAEKWQAVRADVLEQIRHWHELEVGLRKALAYPLDRFLSVPRDRLGQREFEDHLCEVFDFLGYGVERTGRNADPGVSFVLVFGYERIAVRAVSGTDPVGEVPVHHVFADRPHYRCYRCAVITSGTYLPIAREAAEPHKIILIEGRQIPELIRGETAL